MEKMNFTDQLILEQGEIIFFHEGLLDTGKPFYFYIAVKGTRLKQYFQLVQRPFPPSLDELKKVGVIVTFGEGKPSLELKQHLSEQYGIHHS